MWIIYLFLTTTSMAHHGPSLNPPLPYTREHTASAAAATAANAFFTARSPIRCYIRYNLQGNIKKWFCDIVADCGVDLVDLTADMTSQTNM